MQRRRITNNPPSKSARLPHFHKAWLQVTGSRFILYIVLEGYIINFSSFPVRSVCIPRYISNANVSVCDLKVTKIFFDARIFTAVTPDYEQFVLHLFLMPKIAIG